MYSRWSDLCHPLGPGFLRSGELCLVLVRLAEPTEHLPGERLFLPDLHPVPVFHSERLGDGGVEDGQALSGGEETLPRPHQRAVEGP